MTKKSAFRMETIHDENPAVKDRALTAFKHYTSAFDQSNIQIANKIRHTWHVAENSERIAAALGSKIEAVEPIRLAQQIIPENEKGETESMKTIYLAGGCFWGTQKFFDQFEGILETEVGYANGPTENPSYREVCMKSGHAETVKVVYDPEIISLEELIEYYFMTIDPLAYHRQGADKGIQYRTGIYYVNDEDLPVLEACYAKEQEKYSQEMEVELLPLENFYTAEEYHQKYLDKNPGGYCHIPKKLMELQKNAKGKEKDEELRERIGEVEWLD